MSIYLIQRQTPILELVAQLRIVSKFHFPIFLGQAQGGVEIEAIATQWNLSPSKTSLLECVPSIPQSEPSYNSTTGGRAALALCQSDRYGARTH